MIAASAVMKRGEKAVMRALRLIDYDVETMRRPTIRQTIGGAISFAAWSRLKCKQFHEDRTRNLL